MVIAKEHTMKYLMIVCLATFVLGSVVGCSDDSNRTTSTQSASLQTDTKAVKK